MLPLVVDTLETLRSFVGREVVTSDWFQITQERIQRFAEVTEDRQWIHVDRERAARQSPYGTTVAHGFLTLSLLSQFLSQSIKIRGNVSMGINYGLNRVRFPSPVPAGSKIRARFSLQSLKELHNAFQAVWSAVVEREGVDKPCCVAEWLVRYHS